MADDEKTVELKASEVKALLEQVGTLTAQVKALTDDKVDQTPDNKSVMRTRPIRRHDVTIMFIDEKPVVGMVNVGTALNPVKLYDIPDPKDINKRLLMADLQVRNLKTDKIEVIKGLNFLEFMEEGERRECRVIKSRNEEWYIDQGTVMKQEVKDYRVVSLDIEVPVEIEGTVRHYIVEIEGKGVEIHEDYVNMTKSSARAEKIVRGIEE